ncbi:ATP-binding cassette domain-containing protein [Pollutimonas sp. M17]|uniref:ATP-binding cassette domain-containing protein n=1 Tax=Pollutimonas sp. M17 TaxID=2962065 RepID=UPI0021F473FB|nr:ATP-binding cassette domain-containing protein [Pollutimonas sp. M17]UYO92178.1 ATP-binding cassette domain-containing protein [Pollutimonas sp. M17]
MLRTVGHVLWRFRRRAAAALALLVAAKLLAVLVPVALKGIVDSLEPGQGELVLPVFLLLGYALLRFASGLFTELRDMVFARVTQTAVADFTVRMFDHLHSLGVRFHGGHQTGMFSRDVQRGTAGVGFLLGTALFTVLPTLIEIVSVVLIMIFAYRLGFAGIVAVTFIVYGIYTVVFTEKRTPYQRRLNDLDSAAAGHLVDSLMNYETVKFYTSEAFESQRLRDTMKKWIGVGIDNQKALSVLHVGQSGIIALGVAAVMILAGQEVVDGRMAVGDLVLVNAYIIQVCLPLNALGLVFRQAREAMINAERMSDLLRYPPETEPGQPLPPLRLDKGEVVFKQVDFSYEPGRRILHEVDFRIEPGATVAVVGGSGSGKSTLARLLLRFYDVDSGSVTVDGQDVRAVSLKSLRAAIGVVPQDSLLFNNTIAYNIAYGREGASLADVIEAARAARIHELIQSLPAQYDTLVGERGVKLSGGERQRIAIARAVLKNPPLLVFDEATSALDTRTERAIQAELELLAQGRSTLIIAHRLSTIIDADLILVMDHGRIVERGTHAQLLRAKGTYAQMWDLQRQQNALDESGARLSAQPVNLTTLVAGVLDAMRPQIDEKGIVLYTLISADSLRVTGDPSVLQQVLCEVCENAIAFTPPSERLELRVERDGPHAMVAVTDRRLLPQETVEEDGGAAAQSPAVPVLDPTRVNGMLEQMGGGLQVQPSEDGGGMTFAIRLPLRAVATLAPAAPKELTGGDRLKGLTVFVADDQAEARQLLGEVLQDQGSRVELFDSGQPLLSALRERPPEQWPDALICDISLGEPDGYEVIAQIRTMEAQRKSSLAQRLPAIALSGYAEREHRLRALLAGFQVHVAKPVDPRELLATVLAVARPPVISGKAEH